MPSRLSNAFTSPPNGHRFFVKSTGVWIGPEPDRSSLRQKLNAHCKTHQIQVPSDAEIDEQMCEYLPEGWCEDSVTRKPLNKGRISPIGLTVSQILTGTRTLLSHLANGREIVEPVEAERRAAICSMCIFNQKTDCVGCAARPIKELIEKIVGGRSTTKDDSLFGCQICGCHLKALVWMPLDVIRKHEQIEAVERLPKECWKLEGKNER